MDNNLPTEKTFTDELRDLTKDYSTADGVYALVSLLLGWLFVRWTIFTSPVGLGMSLFALAVTAMAVVRVRLSGDKLTRAGWFWAVSAAVYGVVPSFTTNDDAAGMSLFFAALCFLMLCARGRHASDTGYILLDALRALFRPFVRYFSVVPAIVSLFVGKSKKSRTALMLLCGIVVGLIPTVAVVTQLMFADAAFEAVMDSVLSMFEFDEYGVMVLNAILGGFCAFYIFGAFAAEVKYSETDESRERAKTLAERVKVAPTVFVVTALVPLLVVYVVFFLSQLGYFMSGFADRLPEGFTVSEYARRGFFELCKVAGINAAIIFVVITFAKRHRVVRIFSVILSVFTMALAVTALSKMFLYIDRFGLTLNRVYPTAFMVLIIVGFALFIVSLYKPFKLLSVVVAVAVVMSASLFIVDPAKIVGRYNVAMYQSGKLDSLDVFYFDDLSPAAAQYLIPLVEDEELGEYVEQVLFRQAGRCYYDDSMGASDLKKWASVSFGDLWMREVLGEFFY